MTAWRARLGTSTSSRQADLIAPTTAYQTWQHTSYGNVLGMATYQLWQHTSYGNTLAPAAYWGLQHIGHGNIVVMTTY